MSNRAYLSLWCRDFGQDVMIDRLEKLLESVPLSPACPGFASVVVRAVSLDEAPLLERDLRAEVVDAAQVAELAREWAKADCACEVEAYWDLWTFDFDSDAWKLSPEKLEIFCQGEDYDAEAWRETGHFWIQAGFEHLFTGHAGLLGSAEREVEGFHPAEAAFLGRMERPENLAEYRRKTQENIRKLMGWAEHMERVLSLDRWRLWSEGEENFEARLDSILAGR